MNVKVHFREEPNKATVLETTETTNENKKMAPALKQFRPD